MCDDAQSDDVVDCVNCVRDDERCELNAEDNFCENSGVFMMKFVKNNEKAFTCERANLLL